MLKVPEPHFWQDVDSTVLEYHPMAQLVHNVLPVVAE